MHPSGDYIPLVSNLAGALSLHCLVYGHLLTPCPSRRQPSVPTAQLTQQLHWANFKWTFKEVHCEKYSWPKSPEKLSYVFIINSIHPSYVYV